MIAPPFAHPIERLRRILLGLIAALIAAQPMAIGMPGDSPPAPLASLTLTLGWFVALVGWAIWHALANPHRRIGGVIALALFALAAVFAVHAWIASPNARLSVLAVWQWAALPVAFFVVGQLSAPPNDARGVFAVIVSTGVAAAAIYVAPLISWLFGITWPAAFTVARWAPEDFEFAAATASGTPGSELRLWTSDLFWIALAAPAAFLFGWRTRVAPFPRDRLLAWAPLALLVIGLAARTSHQVPAPPPSWGTAARMIAASPGGVGPGVYDRFAPRHGGGDTELVLTDPPNSYLGVLATGGWLALGAFAVALAVFVWAIRRPSVGEGPPGRLIRPHWDLHLGGLLGMLGGLALQVVDWPAAESPPILALAFATALRAFAWYCTFAVAENCLMMEECDSAMVISMAAVAVFSIGYDMLRPGLAPAFWVTAALAINIASPAAACAWVGSRAFRLLSVVAAPLVLAAFVLTAYLPAVQSAIGAHRAVRAIALYSGKVDAIRRTDSPAARAAGRSEASRHVRRMILQPLADGMADPTFGIIDADLAAASAPWWAAAWDLGATGEADVQALRAAQTAQESDPASPLGYLAEFHVRLRLTGSAGSNRSEHFARADELVAEIVARDPALQARLRYRLAAAYYAIQDSASGAREALAARELDERAPGPRFQLTDAERRQITAWLTKK